MTPNTQDTDLSQSWGGIFEPSGILAAVHVAVHSCLEFDPSRKDAGEEKKRRVCAKRK